MSTRNTIVDRVLVLLAAIDGITTATDHSVKHPEQVDKKDLPRCFVHDGNGRREQEVQFNNSCDDMAETFDLIVTTFVWDRVDDTRSSRNNLMAKIEAALVDDATLAEYCTVRPRTVTTDQGMLEKYSVWDQIFTVSYQYSHNDGG